MILLSIFIATLFVWLFFIATANLVNNSFPNATGLKRNAILGVKYLFIICNVIYNVTYGSLVFMQLPHKDRLMITLRLIYILETMNQDTWRWKLAYFFCRYLIEPWDWNHCKIAYLYDPK